MNKEFGISIKQIPEIKRQMLIRSLPIFIALNLVGGLFAYFLIENREILLLWFILVNTFIILPFLTHKEVAKVAFKSDGKGLVVDWYTFLLKARSIVIDYPQLSMKYKKENIERGVCVWVLRIYENGDLKFKIPERGYWTKELLDGIFEEFERLNGNLDHHTIARASLPKDDLSGTKYDQFPN